jgi:replicative DNA helicase
MNNPYGRKRDEAAGAEELLATINKPMPYAKEAEDAVLSCWLQNPELLDDKPLRPEAFYQDRNRITATVMLLMRARGSMIDFTTVTHELRHIEKLEVVGGPAQIMEWTTAIQIPTHYPHYRAMVADSYARREAIKAMAQSIQDLQDFGKIEGQKLPDVMEEAKKRVLDLDLESDSAELPARPIATVISDVIDKSGMQEGRFWTVLARSSDGKSSLCRQMIESACSQGHKGVIYTYEMMDDEEAARLLCSQAQIDSNDLQSGILTREQHGNFARVMTQIQKSWDLAIVDVAGKKLEQILRDVKKRRKALKAGQKLVVEIDYIQLCQTFREFRTRQLQIAYITQSIKDCAKINKCTILAPSQVNTNGEAREAADIENDSDVSLKIERLEAKEDTSKKPWQKTQEAEPSPESHRLRNLWVAKNRDGERFKAIPLIFHGSQFRFEQAPQPHN